MPATLPPVPDKFKALQHYLKTAAEHDQRDPVVAYYARMYSVQLGMKIDRSDKECVRFLTYLMDTLETSKRALQGNEALSSEVVGQAHVENYAYKMFLFADNEDRAGRFSKNVVKSFYTAGMLFDVLTQFGDLPPEVEKQRKYAKFKAAYIHNCLKSGETPHAGPFGDEFGDMDQAVAGPSGGGAPLDDFGAPAPPADPPYPGAGGGVYSNPPAEGPGTGSAGPCGYGGAPGTSGYSQPSSYDPQGRQPTHPQHTPEPASAIPAGITLTPQQNTQCQKWCKYAISSLQYDDVNTAVDYLEKSLCLLKTGK